MYWKILHETPTNQLRLFRMYYESRTNKMISGPILNILEVLSQEKYMYMYKKSVTAALFQKSSFRLRYRRICKWRAQSSYVIQNQFLSLLQAKCLFKKKCSLKFKYFTSMCAISFCSRTEKHKISYQSVLLGIQMLPKHAENKTCTCRP